MAAIFALFAFLAGLLLGIALSLATAILIVLSGYDLTLDARGFVQFVKVRNHA